ncbi:MULTISPECIES: YiiX/YebB-like N1pC/P60 family cysteine hydrolase [Brevibacillus]|jgi:Uncharacterized distant relative of cell wall-associated hydrolases|uniref:Septation ring formation regulator EzrA n=1 Tax=Brevibacillus parabrevis TaxID=54914 RepID=A0A4Y3PJY8_BREPA|nr:MULTISPECIES: YiiX/YebB-like N1pC/P60 family cysteine hydrolase [Brevibacillus]MBU8716120.1 hypothetical protein [Brevibacillus parabrevis]MDH6353329.1 uncharacterized protein YycO [Brevibacillus sp. 1238]RNB97611.1 hypothetical protein EDM60_00250 [Brevibacillus parabrevis]UED69478.1 hypothetical protein HP435_02030 [Brevibacillus sp. HD3.3A]GEB34810.1 hypothetical protein BPA01_43900 [Brevibacillus parabrevis]
MKKLLSAFAIFALISSPLSIVNAESEYNNEEIQKVALASGKSEQEVIKLLNQRQERLKQTRENWSKIIQKQREEFKDEVDKQKANLGKKNEKVEMIRIITSIDPKFEKQNFSYNEESGELQLETTSGTGQIGTYGDILITLDSGSESSGTFYGGHAAIVSEDSNSWTIESFAKGWSPQAPKIDGVYWHINDWANRYDTVAGYHVKKASLSDYTDAALYAEDNLYKPYNFNYFDKWDTTSFYCSQIVWRAWYNQGFNLDSDGGDEVWPEDIANSSKVIPFYSAGI